MSAILYHGSREYRGDLDPEKTQSGYGVWFTKNKAVAEKYALTGRLYKAKVTLVNPFLCLISDYQITHQSKGRNWRVELLDGNYDGIIIDNCGDFYYIPLRANQIDVLD